MHISVNSWHYQIYVFMHRICLKFVGDDYWYEAPHSKKVNLCPYMRTILIWGPLVILFHLAWLLLALTVFVWIPLSVSGVAAYSWTLGVFFVGLSFLTVISIISFLGLKFLGDRSQRKRKERQIRKLNGESEPITFWSSLREYLKSVKSKTCIQLEIKE